MERDCLIVMRVVDVCAGRSVLGVFGGGVVVCAERKGGEDV